MEKRIAIGLVLLTASYCIGSFVPVRKVETETVNVADFKFLRGPPQEFKGLGDTRGDKSVESFWKTLEEEDAAAEDDQFHEANDDDLEVFPWSQTSNDNVDDDDENVARGYEVTPEDLDDLFFDALSAEDRINFGGVGSWIKTKAGQLGNTAKVIFVRTGGKKLLQQGLNLIKALKVRIDPLNCANKSCGSCIYVDIYPLNGQKACVRFGMLETTKIGALLRLGDRILFEQSFGLSSNAFSISLPFPIGSVSLQSVQVAKNETNMGFCMIVAIKQFKVGGQFCAKFEDGRLKPSFKAMQLPVEEKFDTLFVLDENNKVKEVTPEVDVATNL